MSDLLLKKIDEYDDKHRLIYSYNTFVNVSNKGPFLGPQPLQILPKDIPSLVNNTVLTPKIDGVRFLCIIKKNAIGFVNRGMEFYIPKILDNSVGNKIKHNVVTIKTDTKDPKEIKLLQSYLFSRPDEKHLIETIKNSTIILQNKIKKIVKDNTDKIKILTDKIENTSEKNIEALNKKIIKLTKNKEKNLRNLEKSKSSLNKKYQEIKGNLKQAIISKKSKEILALTKKLKESNYDTLKEKLENDMDTKIDDMEILIQNKTDTENIKIQEKIEIKNKGMSAVKKRIEQTIEYNNNQISLLKRIKIGNDKLKKSKKIIDKFTRFVIKGGKIVKVVEKEIKIQTTSDSDVVSRTNHYINTQTNSTFLLDCEIVDSNGTLQIFLFDFVMVQNNNNIIEKVYKLPFFGRMDHLENMFTNIIDPLNERMKNKKMGIKFYKKKYYDFNIFRKDISYEKILDINNEDMKLSGNEKIEYDGIIFVKTLFRYYLAPGPARGQYKWKPKNKLTIDLKIVKSGSKWKALGKYDNKNIEINKKNISAMLSTKNFKNEYNNKVYEFLYEKGKFVLHEPIIERTLKGANAFFTIKSTIEAGKKHFTMEQFKSFVNYMTEDKNLKIKDISCLDKETAIIIMALCKGNDFFDKKQKKELQDKFLPFFKNKPGSIKMNEDKQKELKLLNRSQKRKIDDIKKYIDKFFTLGQVSTVDLFTFLNSYKGKNILFRGDYYELLDSVNKEFKLSPRTIFRKNKLIEDYINKSYSTDKLLTPPKLPEGVTEDYIVEYKQEKKKINRLTTIIIYYLNAIKSADNEIISFYKSKFKNYNKYIKVLLFKKNEDTVKNKMSNKADDFYKILSILKGFTNNPLYSGDKTLIKKVKVGEKEFNFIMNREHVNVSNIFHTKEITSNEIFYSQTLNFENDLNYDIRVELGHEFSYDKSHVKHVSLPKKGDLHFQTIFTFSIPGISWIIKLIKTTKETQVEQTNKEKRDRQFLKDQIHKIRDEYNEILKIKPTKEELNIMKEQDKFLKVHNIIEKVDGTMERSTVGRKCEHRR